MDIESFYDIAELSKEFDKLISEYKSRGWMLRCENCCEDAPVIFFNKDRYIATGGLLLCDRCCQD